MHVSSGSISFISSSVMTFALGTAPPKPIHKQHDFLAFIDVPIGINSVSYLCSIFAVRIGLLMVLLTK